MSNNNNNTDRFPYAFFAYLLVPAPLSVCHLLSCHVARAHGKDMALI